MRHILSKALTVAVLVGSALPAIPAHAHIRLLKPASWVTEDGLGDPQKDGPCGTGTDLQPPQATGAITTFKPGETITVEWEVTIPHTGWYRIALAKERSELADPDVEPDFLCYPTKDVPTGAHGNVLADGLYMDSSDTRFSHDITLPDEPCENCTLQVIQYMTLHTQPCIYYHCAALEISGEAVSEPDASTDAGSATDAGRPTDAGARDSGRPMQSVDSGAVQSEEDAGMDDDDEEHASDEHDDESGSGAKRDAGSKRDASSSSDEDESDDDDDDGEPRVNSGGDDGCAARPAGAKSLGAGELLLLLFGAVTVRRLIRRRR